MPKKRRANAPTSPGTEDLDLLLDRFDRAWQNDSPPAIEDFLPAVPGGRRRLLRELIKIDLEYRWRRSWPGRAGASASPGRPRLEDYVGRFPWLGSSQKLPVDLIGEEYRMRQRWAMGRAMRSTSPASPSAQRRCGRRWAGSTPTCAPNWPPRAAAASRPPRRQGAVVRVGNGSDPLPALSAGLGGRRRLAAAEHRLPRLRRGLPRGGAFGRPRPGRHAPLAPVGRYELGELMGTGAFGSVWQAWDTELGREVAVKLPRSGRFTSPSEEERSCARPVPPPSCTTPELSPSTMWEGRRRRCTSSRSWCGG